jgi:hypothetical protein
MLTTRAFENGITYGRAGKGSVFIWASGNGGNCKLNATTNPFLKKF